jgi:acetyl-CoA carboxylase biotin carboxylase subunit
VTSAPAPSRDRAPEARRLRRVLIANRGEIAVRIVRACRDIGLESVVAYSEPDRGSLATRLADRAVCIGPARAAESYLNQDAILTAATALGADAIHPGYGFLAENASFATAVEDAGLAFIGPRPEAVELMGNKMEARRIAAALGLPVIPGSAGGIAAEEARGLVEEIGYPIIVKAAAGGGGRGMRLVATPAELEAVLAAASAEAMAAFGNGAVYVEKYLGNARHIEVQVAFDAHGRGIHLGERDCTVQRRFQKLIEESPSPALATETRTAIADAALTLCRHADYRGVGTVEFLYDQDARAFYFIEMNTRLQVEHPVTELVTGIDLVALQLRIGAGEALPFKQTDVGFDGHAIEFRINAEDPEREFTPAAGRLRSWSVPLGPGVRVDTHCEPGYLVPPFYDSLLAKVIVAGRDRHEVLARSRRALAELVVEGLPTTQGFHQWALDHEDFITGRTNTNWAERTWTRRA